MADYFRFNFAQTHPTKEDLVQAPSRGFGGFHQEVISPPTTPIEDVVEQGWEYLNLSEAFSALPDETPGNRTSDDQNNDPKLQRQ